MNRLKAKSFKRTVGVAMLTSALLVSATPSYASPVTTPILTNQAEQLESKIQLLDNKIIESMEKVKQLNEDMEKEKARISKIEIEIKEAEESFEAHKELYLERVRTLQLEGSPMMIYLEILFKSDGFSDFLNRSTAIATFIQSDQEILEGLVEKETELKEQKKELNKTLKSLEKNKETLAQEQKSIELDKKEVQKELAKTKDKIKQEEALQRAEAEARQRAEVQVQQISSVKPSASLPAVNATTLPFASDKAKAVIANAQNYLGVPYVWGGTTPSGFDCSGLTQYVYRSVGVNLPRVSRDQQNFGTPISPSQVQPGDLVFIGKPAYHVGIYIGNGQYLHAPQTGDVVKIASYNPSAFTSASRVLR